MFGVNEEHLKEDGPSKARKPKGGFSRRGWCEKENVLTLWRKKHTKLFASQTKVINI